MPRGRQRNWNGAPVLTTSPSCADDTPVSFPRRPSRGCSATVNPLPNLEPTWNMAPTRDAPVVRLSRDGERHLDALKWGLVPYFTKDLKKARKPINARSETIAKSGMFKEAFAKRRCLVPAPVYYEWRDDPEGKTPFAVARVDGDPVAFGGIWEAWKSPEGETPADLRHHHHGREQAARRDTGPDAGDHRAGGLAALAGRSRGRSRRTASTGAQRTCCGSGRSTRRSATSGTTGLSCSSRARLRKPHSFSRFATHPDLRVLNLLALQKLDHLAFRACHESDADFYQRVLAQDGCAWRNARHPARREGAGIGSLCVGHAQAEMQQGAFSALLLRPSSPTFGLNRRPGPNTSR